MVEKKLCKCGCGQEVNKRSRYIRGHSNYGRKYTKETIQKMRDSQLGEKGSFFGRKHTKETKRKIGKANKGKIVSEETREKISKSRKGKKLSQETKDRMSESTKGVNNPMYGKTGINSVHFGKKHSEETKQKRSESLKGEKNPMYGKHHTEESKNKISELLSGEKNPNYGKPVSEERRQKQSEFMKGRYIGVNNPNWNNGSSFEPYCIKFTKEFKERVRNFFNRTCFNCGIAEKNSNRKLSIHHVNYDKMVCCNDVTPLFVPLCHSCHAKTNHNREYWEEKFTKELMEKYDDKCYLPKNNNQ